MISVMRPLPTGPSSLHGRSAVEVVAGETAISGTSGPRMMVIVGTAVSLVEGVNEELGRLMIVSAFAFRLLAGLL